MAEDDREPLAETFYEISKNITNIGRNLFYVLLAIATFSTAAVFYWFYARNELNLGIYLILIICTSIGAIIWFALRGKQEQGRIQNWTRDYILELYILRLGTTVPEGNSTAEKVMSLVRTVFPELRLLRKAENESDKDVISQGLNFRVGGYILDLVIKNRDGEYFIVKDFGGEPVTIDALKQLANVIKNGFGQRFGRLPKGISRVICVAKEYDPSFLQSELAEKNMKMLSKNLRIDLLVEEKNGYSLLWVS